MKVYKVVAVLRDTQGAEHFRSARVYDTPGVFVTYRVGETSSPVIKGSPLMAFGERGSAEDFRGLYSTGLRFQGYPISPPGMALRGLTILRCEATPFHSRRPGLAPVDDRMFFAAAWRGYLSGNKPEEIQAAWWARVLEGGDWCHSYPADTVLCETITPLEVITPWATSPCVFHGVFHALSRSLAWGLPRRA
jgi:hypothetical protein